MVSFRFQVMQQKQLSKTGTPNQPSALPLQMANVVVVPTVDLRAQLQPFQDFTPQQIEEQLQRMSIEQRNDPEFSQPPGILETSLTETSGSGECGSDSSIASSGIPSRKSSTASVLAQLLSPSPPAIPIQSPQTQGIPSSMASLCSQSPPYQEHLLARRLSNPYDSMTPLIATTNTAKQHRCTLPELYSTRNPLVERTAQVQNAHLPSFPVNVQQKREGSPTKSVYGSSPSGAGTIGRISPIREVQMDSIAEDSTETPANARPISPPYLPAGSPLYCPVGSPRNSKQQEEQRQRRTGVIDTAALRAQVAATLEPNGGPSHVNNHKHIINALQMPLFSPPAQEPMFRLQTTPTPTYPHLELYTNGLNHYNMPPYAMHPGFYSPHGHMGDILHHISTVLNMCGIPFQHCNGVFAVDHQGVKLQILVGSLPHVATPSAIQLQYIAGDTHKYQSLCTQLASQLQFAGR